MATIRKAFRMEFLERKYGELEFLETGFSFVSKAPFRFRRLPMCLVFRVFPRERVGGRVSEMSGDGGGQRTPAHCSPAVRTSPAEGAHGIRVRSRALGYSRGWTGPTWARTSCRAGTGALVLPPALGASRKTSQLRVDGARRGRCGDRRGRGCGERTPQQHPAAEAFTFP